MKKVFFALILTLFAFNAFCVGGNIFHRKKLSIIKTQYFDIIFYDETFEDAKKIASVADSYYLEISKKFGFEPYQRFPVSLTCEEESLNGFFSPFPYNMIVLHIAEPDSPEMSSYQDTLLSVFYHELTHAVTLNMKSPFWRGMSSVFGDFLSPAALSMTYFWIEGAAVLNESGFSDEKNKKIDGRLKNPYFTSLLVQAKLNDEADVKKFPSWRDVAGSRDIVPAGSDRYVFGACFAQFLVKNYGKEKYAEFWKNAGKGTTLSFSAGVFKRTYGKKIDEVWNDFKNSIKVPDSKEYLQLASENELKEQNSFLISKKKSYVKANDFFYDKNEKIFKLAFYDSSSCAVFLSEKKENEEKFKKAKKLFSASGIQKISFDESGKKLFVSRLVQKENVKIENGIFDINERKYKRIEKNQNVQPQVSIEKNDLNWKIKVKIDEKNEKEYFPGEKIILNDSHFIKTDEKTAFVSFSWAKFAEKNDDFQNLSLPKCGILKINLENGNGIFYLQKKETFAGKTFHSIKKNVLVYSDEKNTIIAASLEDYDANPFYFLVFPSIEDENFWQKIPNELKTDDEIYSENQKKLESKKSDEIKFDSQFEIKKFSSFPYLFKGTVLPVGLSPLKNSDFELESIAFLGATYVTSKPYLNDFVLISAGYEPFYKDAGALLYLHSFDGKTSFSSSSSVFFDKDAFKQAAENLTFSRNLWLGLVSSFSAGVSFDAFYGRENKQNFKIIQQNENGNIQIYDGKFWNNGFFTSSRFYLSFSNFHKVSPKHNQIFGFSFEPFLDFEYKNYKEKWNFDDEDYESEKITEKYLNAGISAGAKFPGIFPLSLTSILFPSSSYLFWGTAKANLLSIEIQKGIPAASIYATRFDLNLSYSAKISFLHGDFWDISNIRDIVSDVQGDDYSDSVSLSGLFTFSPNTSYAADSSVQFQLGASFIFRPNPENGKSKTSFGITGNIGL